VSPRDRRSGSLAPDAVLAAIARTAARLCEARDCLIFIAGDDRLRLAAKHGTVRYDRRLGETRDLDPRTPMGRAFLTRKTVHVRDRAAAARHRFPESRVAQCTTGVRTLVATPLLRDGAAIGGLVIRRTTVRPFSGKPLALLKAFADQAVIAIENAHLFTEVDFSPAQTALLKTFVDQAVSAIENVRLFTELQARTRELAHAVDQLTALGEVGRAVSSSLGLETVLSTIVSRAGQLAGADACSVHEYDEAAEEFHLRATHGMDEAIAASVRAQPIRKGEGAAGRLPEVRATPPPFPPRLAPRPTPRDPARGAHHLVRKATPVPS
jgi:GAF domain-containing protein